jgi:transposase
MMDIATLGIDLAKNMFQVHGVDEQSRTVVQRQLRRPQVLPFVAQLRPCLVAMEACGGVHYWAREIAKRGHEVRRMGPRFVRPYVKSNKNDVRDAEAICVRRPSMRFVAVKSQAQQDMLALHRVRSLLIGERTALMNQMRGLLAEYGIVITQGAVPLRRALVQILEARDNGVSELLRELLGEMSERLRLIEPLKTVRPADRGIRPRRRARRSSDGGRGGGSTGYSHIQRFAPGFPTDPWPRPR